MNIETASPLLPADHDHARRKRSKEELEALAQNFIATPGAGEPSRAIPKRVLMVGGGAAAAVVLVLAAVALWPKAEEAPAARQAAASRAAQQAEELRKNFEADRARARQAAQAGSDYMNRIAQADSEVLKDMQSRAGALAARAAAPSDAPTPKDLRKAPAPAPAPSKLAQNPVAPAPAAAAATASAPEPAKPGPQDTPQQQAASAAPAAAQSAPAASCKIHVSELSSSGKLTYDAVKAMKGARVDEKTGHVYTPPVKTGSQSLVFEVLPTGCVNVVRSLRDR